MNALSGNSVKYEFGDYLSNNVDQKPSIHADCTQIQYHGHDMHHKLSMFVKKI